MPKEKDIIAKIEKKRKYWQSLVDQWIENGGKGDIPSLASLVEPLLFALDGCGGNRKNYEWMLLF